jgi:hypothetical protein
MDRAPEVIREEIEWLELQIQSGEHDWMALTVKQAQLWDELERVTDR